MIPQKAIDLILGFEGLDQPAQWPGGQSGITIGYGYDLGYEKNFAGDWDGILPANHYFRLRAACGLTGPGAKASAPRFADIRIMPAAARSVFLGRTLPHYEEETQHAFPGVEILPPLAYGALVSLVYNRGSGMVGPRRLEMRAIRDAIAALAAGQVSLTTTLHAIAAELRAMKKLWEGQGLDGLIRRREAEAELVESTIAG